MGLPVTTEELDSDTTRRPEVARGQDPVFVAHWNTPRRSLVTRNQDLRWGTTGGRDLVRSPVPVTIAMFLTLEIVRTCPLTMATTRNLLVTKARLGDLNARWTRESLRRFAIEMGTSGKLGKVTGGLTRVNATRNGLVMKVYYANKEKEGLVTRGLETKIKKGSWGRWEQ